MKRLTKKLLNGNWNVNGCPWDKIPDEIYGALCKLKDYEDTGLDPETVMNYKTFEDEVISKGLTFDQILEIIDRKLFYMTLNTKKPTKSERANMTREELLRSVWLLDDVIESMRWIPLPEAYKGA